LRLEIRIASHCQDRALLLLQVVQECPQFKEQADYLAHEWLVLAAMRIDLARTRQAEKVVRTQDAGRFLKAIHFAQTRF
jgi:hypothetical protein